MKKILFYGDSITDAGRITMQNAGAENHLGFGYPAYVAAELGTKFPARYEFSNKGISGNKITDLYARMKRDVIKEAPDYLSIKIGTNDVWHGCSGDGVSDERFEELYRWLLDDIKAALPDIKIMIMSPYCDSITANIFEGFNDCIKQKAAISKKIADEYNLVFMDTQKVIDKAQEAAPIEYWTRDGVHPTIYGHKLIADEWIKHFEILNK